MVWVLWLSLFAGWIASAQTNPPAPGTVPELQQRFEQVLTRPAFAEAFWGVKVVSLDSGKTLFEHNPQKLFSPASNCKLYTVALAFERLGAGARLRTSLYAAAKPNRRGTLKGDLMVYGRGDPTINGRLHGGNVFEALKPFVDALAKAGVKRVRGNLVADDSYFRGPEYGSGWVWDDLEYSYGAEISALTIDGNVVSMKVQPGEKVGDPCRVTSPIPLAGLFFSNRTSTVVSGTNVDIRFYRPLGENVIYVMGHMPVDGKEYSENVPVHNPAAMFGQLLKEALRRRGIKVTGKVRTLNWLDRQNPLGACTNRVELGSVDSLPLREIASEVLKPSQNLYTDLLLAYVGESARESQADPEATSEELGIVELKKFLQRVGLGPEEAYFEEGSGLSRDNLTSPNATIKLLQYVSHQSYGQDYITALPVAGVDGTLKSRMRGTVAAGNVHAKTGSLHWASSLSGYVTTAAGEHLAFSFMVNRYQAPPGGGSARGALDELTLLLAGFSGRSTGE